MKPQLSLDLLMKEAGTFAQMESEHFDSAIYGVTDGKAIGTYFEHKSQVHLTERYTYERIFSINRGKSPARGTLPVFAMIW